MADQTTMNGQQQTASPAQEVRRNLAGVGEDLMSLFELQGKLLACDVKEASQRVVLAIALIVGAAVLALGCVPVILMGLGWGLAELSGLSLPLALLIVGGVALLLAAGAVWWGATLSRRIVTVFKRSYCEFKHNLDWIKKVFMQQSQRNVDRFRCN
jgi:hypothetical protein